MAPELLEGKAPTVRADVYALGVLLFQLVVGDLSRVLAPGWEREVEDELLREDVAAMVDGSPERREGDAQRIAERLRALEARRAERRERRLARAAAERARRRWRWVLVLYRRRLLSLEAPRARDPDNPQGRRRLAAAYLDLGELHAALQQTDRARDAWAEAASLAAPLARTSEDEEILRIHATALLHLGRVDDARPSVERLLAGGWVEPRFLELCERHGLRDGGESRP